MRVCVCVCVCVRACVRACVCVCVCSFVCDDCYWSSHTRRATRRVEAFLFLHRNSYFDVNQQVRCSYQVSRWLHAVQSSRLFQVHQDHPGTQEVPARPWHLEVLDCQVHRESRLNLSRTHQRMRFVVVIHLFICQSVTYNIHSKFTMQRAGETGGCSTLMSALID